MEAELRHRPARPRAAASADPNTPAPAPSDALVDEIGDLLFAVVNLARKAGVQPGPALDRANRKFRDGSRRSSGWRRSAGSSCTARAGGAGRTVGRGEGERTSDGERASAPPSSLTPSTDTTDESAAETRSPPGCAGCPQIQATVRSSPSPKPECTNVPYFRRSRYQRYASGSSPCCVDPGQQLVVVVLALRAADDLAVSLRREAVVVEHRARIVRVLLHVEGLTSFG